MFKRILLPLDGSPLAEAALDSAKALAEKFAGEIMLLRVAPMTRYPITAHGRMDTRAYYDMVNTIREQEMLEAARYLQELNENLTGEGYRVDFHVQSANSPAKAILAMAQLQPIDIIVMSTHGRGGFARWVYGSVAEKVMRHSPVPVLLVRPDPKDLEANEPADILAEKPA